MQRGMNEREVQDLREGDKVICVLKSAIGFFGTVGEVYTVKQKSLVSLKLEEDPGNTWNSADRFVRFQEKEIKTEEKQQKQETFSPEKLQCIKAIEELESKIKMIREKIKNLP